MMKSWVGRLAATLLVLGLLFGMVPPSAQAAAVPEVAALVQPVQYYGGYYGRPGFYRPYYGRPYGYYRPRVVVVPRFYGYRRGYYRPY